MTTTPTLQRLLTVRQSSFGDMECSIQGTSLRKCQKSRFGLPEVVFQVRVTIVNRRGWTFHCTLRDVARLHSRLLATVQDNEFTDQLGSLVCPTQPWFGRKNAAVIKGMCCDLDHYLSNLLRICQRFILKATRDEAIAVESTIRSFLNPSTISPMDAKSKDKPI
ncbi:hypothetical protein LEN26_014781 [Aphanomyces euteiches]|nr:hypothetical protein LEN26_014781 [Aphanomyces euteiches]KAH9108311.1 hypothetical protein AeMF1_016508 [Aphanomyces euteiches]KAH9183068.1 hypothetical protein AeNC1_014954 [Aphanomyces euteiches]